MLVREEIELAKAEVTRRSRASPGRGRGGRRAVFGVFAVVFLLLTAAWGLTSLSAASGSASLIVFGAADRCHVGAFLFAWRKLRVGCADPEDGDRRGEEDPRDRRASRGGALMATRSPEEIRASIEQNRQELGTLAREAARSRSSSSRTGARRSRHQPQVMIGAAVGGVRARRRESPPITNPVDPGADQRLRSDAQLATPVSEPDDLGAQVRDGDAELASVGLDRATDLLGERAAPSALHPGLNRVADPLSFFDRHVRRRGADFELADQRTAPHRRSAAATAPSRSRSPARSS